MLREYDSIIKVANYERQVMYLPFHYHFQGCGRSESVMNKMDTLQYYNDNAMEFVSGTEFADVSVLREKFLNKIPAGGMILD